MCTFSALSMHVITELTFHAYAQANAIPQTVWWAALCNVNAKRMLSMP